VQRRNHFTTPPGERSPLKLGRTLDVSAMEMPRAPIVGKKVLIVDDDEQHLKMTERLLRGAGYDVVTRSDVLGTSFVVSSVRPDVVLVDLNMPMVNGDRLVPLMRRGRFEPPYTSPFVVLYSGIDSKELERRARDCGADDCIPKGLVPKQFLARVADCFAKAAAALELRESHDG
jgi:PleD family two-component response regulator